MRRFFVLPLLCVASLLPGRAQAATVLGIEGTRFTLDGKPTFLLGISYYGGLGATEDFIRRDLDDLQRYGFNWLRVWATWGLRDAEVSAVDAQGRAREPFLGRLRWLVAECDRRGLIVDVTLTRDAGGRLPDFAAHRQAVATLVETLKARRNWYLDLANERDIRDGRYVPVAEINTLREQVRRLDPQRLVTASFGGHDLSEEDVRTSLVTAGLDFLCPHRPRHAESPQQTEARTRALLALMRKLGPVAPVHYQEPFRRGYTQWEPVAADFLADLRGAAAGGAAGWCLHNGTQRNAPDQEPRRSFDLHRRRLFDQLDAEERQVVAEAAKVLHTALGHHESARAEAAREWTLVGSPDGAPGQCVRLRFVALVGRASSHDIFRRAGTLGVPQTPCFAFGGPLRPTLQSWSHTKRFVLAGILE